MSNNKRTEEDLLNMNPADILSFLKAKSGNQPDEVPPGWYTIHGLANAWNISGQHAGNRLNQAVRDGVMEKKPFKIATGGGMVRPVVHFRLVAKGKA